jgi:glycosyltransferase involved in cell wall biosynthesis
MASKVGVCDVILVRAPSPLAPAFHRKFDKKTRIVYLIVGDYTEGVHHLDQPWFRKLMITALSYINDRQLSEAVRKSKTLVNSQKLFNRYVPLTKDINLVRTTTLTKSDFYYRDDTCMGKEVRLLYTGSFSFAKGLRVLLEAFSILYRGNENISLHFVGWEYDPSKPVESFIRKQAVTLGVADRITFHGFKTVGSELNEMYRMADIYIIPSYHEGFPRTIWEAMANSLPVIASNVGSVPHFLENMHDALLIDPGNMQQIVDSVHKILNDSILRRRLIQNGNKLAVQNTLEVLTSHMVNLL